MKKALVSSVLFVMVLGMASEYAHADGEVHSDDQSVSLSGVEALGAMNALMANANDPITQEFRKETQKITTLEVIHQPDGTTTYLFRGSVNIMMPPALRLMITEKQVCRPGISPADGGACRTVYSSKRETLPSQD